MVKEEGWPTGQRSDTIGPRVMPLTVAQAVIAAKNALKEYNDGHMPESVRLEEVNKGRFLGGWALTLSYLEAVPGHSTKFLLGGIAVEPTKERVYKIFEVDADGRVDSMTIRKL
jgi:hypothetical protein